MRKDIDDFLRETGMHFDTIDLERELYAFQKQMKDGLAGRPSSLMMLPSYIAVNQRLPVDEEVIVVDAGGTNLRIATVKSDRNGEMAVTSFKKRPMPGTQGKLTIEQFFAAMADALEPVLDKSNKIGFCFSFPCEIKPNGDGEILGFNKEVQIEGAEGYLLGAGINQVLSNRGKVKKKFVVLNDTVACMLGGLAFGTKNCHDSYVGYILGTGTNTCYLEKCKNVLKSPVAQTMDGQMAINMESGGYDGFSQGLYDRQLDIASHNPGDHKLEKMISGAYQGATIFRTVQGAACKGIFSQPFVERLINTPTFTAQQVSEFYSTPFEKSELSALCAGNVRDQNALKYIIEVNTERAAKITTVNFGAIADYIGAGRDPGRPLCIMAEGTSFKKSQLFRNKLDSYIRSFLNENLGIYCEILTADDVTLTGTAVAAILAE